MTLYLSCVACDNGWSSTSLQDRKFRKSVETVITFQLRTGYNPAPGEMDKVVREKGLKGYLQRVDEWNLQMT